VCGGGGGGVVEIEVSAFCDILFLSSTITTLPTPRDYSRLVLPFQCQPGESFKKKVPQKHS